MIRHAEHRIVDLKKRGFEHAGLYDPQGVGGTHVMYVLHHADQPELYHGLPKNPKISEIVRFWKGIWKPLSAAAFVATFSGLLFHYMGVGAIEVDEDDIEEEKEADKQARKRLGLPVLEQKIDSNLSQQENHHG